MNVYDVIVWSEEWVYPLVNCYVTMDNGYSEWMCEVKNGLMTMMLHDGELWLMMVTLW